MKNIITIGREYGSGGRTIGKKVAEMLGYDYYDRELIDEAAKESGLSDTAEHVTHTFHGFGKLEKDCRIDYIFTNAPFENGRRVEDAPVDGVYISDHHPMVADVEI